MADPHNDQLPTACGRQHLPQAYRADGRDDEGTFQFESKEENAVHLALRQLPEKYRIVLQLFYFEDMSIDMISRTLQIKPGTIKVQLNRGREMMKAKIREVDA